MASLFHCSRFHHHFFHPLLFNKSCPCLTKVQASPVWCFLGLFHKPIPALTENFCTLPFCSSGQVPAAGVADASLKKAERKLYNPYILFLSFLLLRLLLFHPPPKCHQILIKVLFLRGLDINPISRFSERFCGQHRLYLPVVVWLSFCIPAIHIIIVY